MASSIGRQVRAPRPGGTLMLSRSNNPAIKTGASGVVPGVQGDAPPATAPSRAFRGDSGSGRARKRKRCQW